MFNHTISFTIVALQYVFSFFKSYGKKLMNDTVLEHISSLSHFSEK